MYIYERYTLDLLAKAARSVARSRVLLEHHEKLKAQRRAYVLQRDMLGVFKKRKR